MSSLSQALIWPLKSRDSLEPLEGALFLEKENNHLTRILKLWIWDDNRKKPTGTLNCSSQRCFSVCRGALPLGSLTFPRSWERCGRYGLCHINMLRTTQVDFRDSLKKESYRLKKAQWQFRSWRLVATSFCGICNSCFMVILKSFTFWHFKPLDI